jgi:hypothetical protein
LVKNPHPSVRCPLRPNRRQSYLRPALKRERNFRRHGRKNWRPIYESGD